MSTSSNRAQLDAGILRLLDELVACDSVQSNCMFQLSLMLARVALEPCSDAYKEETAQALLGLIRNKPKSNVVSMIRFGVKRSDGVPPRSSTAV
jgi:hypothetical protein